jgi:hypothetical protein
MTLWAGRGKGQCQLMQWVKRLEEDILDTVLSL